MCWCFIHVSPFFSQSTPRIQRESSGVHPCYRRRSFRPHNTCCHVAKHKALLSLWTNSVYSRHTKFCTKESFKDEFMAFRSVFNDVWNTSYVPRDKASCTAGSQLLLYVVNDWLFRKQDTKWRMFKHLFNVITTGTQKSFFFVWEISTLH